MSTIEADKPKQELKEAEKPPPKKSPRAKKTVPRPKKPPTPKTESVEYVEIDFALSNADGSKVRDLHGGSRSAKRTDRFRRAKVYRTGEDVLTIQDANGDEYLFAISRLQILVGHVGSMAITSQVPNFNNR